MLYSRLVPHLRLAGALALLALARQLAEPSPPSKDVDALATALNQSIGGGASSVAPEDLRWEPSEGALVDFVYGRWAVLLGAPASGAPRDVYRARIRLTPEGRPISVAEIHNLTQTPLGDDHALVVRDHYAAFATLAYGQEQSVSLLDLSGEGANATFDFADEIMAAITNVQQTGSRRGIGRVDITLDPPARTVGLALRSDARLAIDFAEEEGVRHASYDPARAELGGTVTGLRAEATRHLSKRFVFWVVDTTRAVPWIGPEPIAWLEDKVFGARDRMKQFAFKMRGTDATTTLASATDATAGTGQPSRAHAAGDDRGTGGTRVSVDDDASFPPPPVPSIWKTREPGEGDWQAPKIPWMKKMPGTVAGAEVPAPFVRTFVRPDPDRPYSQVLLVAMDMRQLELRMEAGSEDPKPLTGGHGPGRLPRDPAINTRVVAAFNGAFKTEHGNYGMMVNKRVLLPPQPGAASIVVLKDGRAGFGTWGPTREVTGIRGVADDDILSFRQNLDPLVDKGEVNPNKRALWGYTLPGSGTQTERSGVCATDAGHVIYAWGEDVSATALGKAMKMAGCSYAVHLDMNPHHTGFLFTAIDDIKAKKYRAEVLTTQMEISQDRYIEYAAKDFFYVLFHDPMPPPVDGGVWTASPGGQPAPLWQPGFWEARVATPQGLVDVFDVEADRASFHIRAGAHDAMLATEAGPSTASASPTGSATAPALAPVGDLASEDGERVLFTVGLGAAIEHHPRGLAISGKSLMPVRAAPDSALLRVSAERRLTIVKPEEAASQELGPGEDLAEVLLLLDEGAMVRAARARPPAGGPRAALGTTSDGRVVVARSASGNEAALADALRRAGCLRAVVLDRGNHAEPVLERAGTASPPRAHYDQTVVAGMARSLRPRAFRFDAVGAPASAAQAAQATK